MKKLDNNSRRPSPCSSLRGLAQHYIIGNLAVAPRIRALSCAHLPATILHLLDRNERSARRAFSAQRRIHQAAQISQNTAAVGRACPNDSGPNTHCSVTRVYMSNANMQVCENVTELRYK